MLTNFGKIHRVTHLMKILCTALRTRNVQAVGGGVVDEMYTLAHLRSALDVKLCPYSVPRHVYQTSTAEKFEASKGAIHRSVWQFQKLHAVSSTDCSIKLSFQEHCTLTLCIFNVTEL